MSDNRPTENSDGNEIEMEFEFPTVTQEQVDIKKNAFFPSNEQLADLTKLYQTLTQKPPGETISTTTFQIPFCKV